MRTAPLTGFGVALCLLFLFSRLVSCAPEAIANAQRALHMAMVERDQRLYARRQKYDEAKAKATAELLQRDVRDR